MGPKKPPEFRGFFAHFFFGGKTPEFRGKKKHWIEGKSAPPKHAEAKMFLGFLG